MALLKNLLNLISPLFPFADFLYVLQLEEYETTRYISRLQRFFLRRNIQKRDTLKLTSRLLLTLIVAIALIKVLVISVHLLFGIIYLTAAVFILSVVLFVPFFIIPANILLTPLFEIAKKQVQRKAKKYMSRFSDLKVIAIAGSYGKTTTKNFLYELIRYSYKTSMVPGNINTPTGIANWLLTHFDESSQVLIVEMDTYFKGEIAASCAVVQPDIAILTNIGDQHLERHGTRKQLAQALSEVFTHSKKDAFLITDAVTSDDLTEFGITIEPTIIDEQHIMYESERLKVEYLSPSAQHNLRFALRAAEHMHIPSRFIADSVTSLQVPERRQQLTKMFGYDAIDDSYNISLSTAKAGLLRARELAGKHKELIVITAGIPELGQENSQGNEQYSALLSQHANVVFVLQSIFHKDLEKYMDKNKVHHVKNLQQTVQLLQKRYKPEKCLLLVQPELTDLYY